MDGIGVDITESTYSASNIASILEQRYPIIFHNHHYLQQKMQKKFTISELVPQISFFSDIFRFEAVECH